MPNINFELNLNKHPKDVPNRALVSANNVQLSGDLSCLQSEFCIKENVALKAIIDDNYIAGYIPCNKEFILFIADSDWKEQLDNNPDGIEIKICRFKEQGELKDEKGEWNDTKHRGSFDKSEGKIVYENFVWNGGKLKGAFTYNIKSQLIISIAESNTYTGKDVPLKTINLGKYDDTEDSEDTDLGLDKSLLSLNPEIKIPSIANYNYINGLAYKGWYYFFIRYKINSVDYTKWFSLGYPILIDAIEKYSLFDYNILKESDDKVGNQYVERGYCNIQTEISSNSNTCNTTIEFTIDNLSKKFKNYQIGFVCSTKDSQRAFKSLDIDIKDENNIFYLDYSSLEEYSVNDLVFEHYNYYNVKNVINYKNRLYISNYKENNFDYEELKEFAKNIKLSCTKNIDDKFNDKFEPIDKSAKNFDFNNITLYSPFGNRTISSSDIRNGTSWQNRPDSYYTSLNLQAADSWRQSLYIMKASSRIDFDDIEISNPNTANPNSPQRVTVIFKINGNQFKVTVICLYRISYGTSYYTFPTSSNGDSLGIEIRISDYKEGLVDEEYVYRFESRNIINTFNNRLKDRTLIPRGYYKFYVHFVNKYGEFSDGIPITRNILAEYDENLDDGFENYSEYSKELLTDNTLFIVSSILGSRTDYYNYELRKYYLNCSIINNINSNNIIGFFLTYEKYNDINDFEGVLINYDFYKIYDDQISDTGKFINYTNKEDNRPIYRFYSDEIDLLDNLQIKSSKLVLQYSGFKNGSNIYSDDEYKRRHFGIIENKQTSDIKNIRYDYEIFDIKNIKYIPAHSFTKNNDYRGSYLEITLFDDDKLSNDSIKEYLKRGCVCRLISNDNSLYKSLNKELIKFTNVIYFEDININENINISAGLNGFVTFNKALIYNNDKLILNNGFNVLVNSDYAAYVGSQAFNNTDSKIKNNNKFQFVMQYSFPMIKEIMYETRRFKSYPEIIATRTKALSSSESQSTFDFASSTIVQPLNSIDLYTLPIGSQDQNNPKIYINHTINYVNQFDKRVVRSNPIADESFENSWRIISPEAYKDITENKGNITNLIALGTTVLVHTEHSIFMFDRDNTLQNGDGKSMQLAMPDVFDIDYKEVLASELGSCGLQDSDAWVLDEFGYIFYDNDAHKFYKFGSKKIESINSSITQFIDKYKPFRVRFANDAESNRILVNIQYRYGDSSIGEETLSYNYIVNKWISFHDYCFDRAFNTKQMLYMIIDRNDNSFSQMYLINRQNNDVQNTEVIKNGIYNQFDNIRDLNQKYDWYLCNVSIMVNDAYELIKTLEHISWKLYKIARLGTNNTKYINTPREELIKPYSGYQLQVYNDNIDTGVIDISVDTESDKNKSVMNYKKPWWQYDNWNFNYLRDIKNAKERLAPFMSRLYGNYFIIRIWFGDITQKCEFETLDCKVINNKTI